MSFRAALHDSRSATCTRTRTRPLNTRTESNELSIDEQVKDIVVSIEDEGIIGDRNGRNVIGRNDGNGIAGLVVESKLIRLALGPTHPDVGEIGNFEVAVAFLGVESVTATRLGCKTSRYEYLLRPAIRRTTAGGSKDLGGKLVLGGLIEGACFTTLRGRSCMFSDVVT